VGTWAPQSIMDYGRRGFDVGVRCHACGRTAVFDAREVFDHFLAKGWNTSVPVNPGRFRCTCGSRELRTMPIAIGKRPAPLPPRRRVLTPIYVRSQAGGDAERR
jgi:hypothetical protein